MISRVLIITGPAGAGKSSLAEAFASSRGAQCVHLSLDSFRNMVKSGFGDPRNGWNDETQRRLDIARANVASVATNYLISEIEVVIDDVVFPKWQEAGLEPWVEAFSPIEVKLVALIPSWEVVLDRNESREAADRIPEEMLRTIYDDMSGWRGNPDVSIIDNSDLSIEETMVAIENALSS